MCVTRTSWLCALLLAVPALAEQQFDPVPAEPAGKPTGLLIRVVQYEGSTNGAITVEVKNPSAAPVDFAAQGLYFVPQGDPAHAPQRLGAVGAFQSKKERRERLTVSPGATERLTLDVYCIDSHRSSPSSSTPFRVAKERMPRALSQNIEVNTKKAAEPMGGVAAPAAKAQVQGEVWRSRNDKWIKLDGEGAQEATK